MNVDLEMIKYEQQILGIIHSVHTQNFRKTYISYPLIYTRTCEYQGGKNISFSEIFWYVLNE